MGRKNTDAFLRGFSVYPLRKTKVIFDFTGYFTVPIGGRCSARMAVFYRPARRWEVFDARMIKKGQREIVFFVPWAT